MINIHFCQITPVPSNDFSCYDLVAIESHPFAVENDLFGCCRCVYARHAGHLPDIVLESKEKRGRCIA